MQTKIKYARQNKNKDKNKTKTKTRQETKLNVEPSLQHSKGTLHIFAPTCLSISEKAMLFTLWKSNTFHEHRPGGVDAVGKVVTPVVVVSIHREVHYGCFSPKHISEQRRLIEYIDVVVGPGHYKKGMPDPTIIRRNDF